MASQALLIICTVTTVHQENSQYLSDRQHSKVLMLLSCVVDSGMALKCAPVLAALKGLDVTARASHVSLFCLVSKECITVSLYKLLHIGICTASSSFLFAW